MLIVHSAACLRPVSRASISLIAGHEANVRRLASEPRHFGSSPPAFDKATKATPTGFRVYRYVVDVHGQLFLHDTVPKNLTSCFKNTDFLDFFFKRVRPNPASRTASADNSTISRHDILHPPASTLALEWSDEAPFNGDMTTEQAASDLYSEACRLGDSEGYEWISPCGPELNLIRSQDAPIVFRELSDDGMLRWAGTLQETFEPDKLVVDPNNGYVYHPSPQPTRRRWQTRDDSTEVQRYGALSLLGSNLVLSRLAEGLDIDPDAFEHGVGGSIEWKGRRYKLGLLGKG
ncbi:uncharacterized protein PAN0_012d4428 [Moesziomyces antarcticus]|uniref:Uncharacterized protein n=2 Tax=Pseudozyma antarctica TaxID=84753 RepID=A0A5C3FZM6_PSEA2|nr:uncharacterized protein PAN0_012d4428 [Moesziomyces antarcticus]GAK66206.1 conserved hypothetical protein [Moesziomyces antarcticus]SPO49249.1 uncharacterized protein PSANT_06940 [Moesziomyces antarcticus]SPO49335.1 uncharacterized protein PSANT_07027 [Moesziomyces antarcticus]SPO49349.1 uncharacterized protein PSANT_07042 [Moesziomyces antarcticus]